MEQQQNQASWESSTKVMDKPAGVTLVKSVGCAACWAAKSISLTRMCWSPTVINLAL